MATINPQPYCLVNAPRIEEPNKKIQLAAFKINELDTSLMYGTDDVWWPCAENVKLIGTQLFAEFSEGSTSLIKLTTDSKNQQPVYAKVLTIINLACVLPFDCTEFTAYPYPPQKTSKVEVLTKIAHASMAGNFKSDSLTVEGVFYSEESGSIYALYDCGEQGFVENARKVAFSYPGLDNFDHINLPEATRKCELNKDTTNHKYKTIFTTITVFDIYKVTIGNYGYFSHCFVPSRKCTTLNAASEEKAAVISKEEVTKQCEEAAKVKADIIRMMNMPIDLFSIVAEYDAGMPATTSSASTSAASAISD